MRSLRCLVRPFHLRCAGRRRWCCATFPRISLEACCVISWKHIGALRRWISCTSPFGTRMAVAWGTRSSTSPRQQLPSRSAATSTTCICHARWSLAQIKLRSLLALGQLWLWLRMQTHRCVIWSSSLPSIPTAPSYILVCRTG